MKLRKLSRRQVLASIPPALLLPTVAGCIPQIGSTGPTTIRVLVPQLQDSIIDTMAERVKALVDELNQDSPNLKFELAKLPTAAVDYADAVATQTGSETTIPDLVIANLGDVPALVDKGLLLPIDRYVKDDRDVKLDDYFPAVLEPNRYKGKLYALPFICSPLVLYYNPRLFAAAGIKPPSATWTLQEFVQIARALTRKGTSGGAGEQFGFIQAPGVPPVTTFIWQNGGDVVDADGRIVIDQPAAVDAIRFMADLTLTERVAPQLSDLGSTSVEDLLLKDKVAMFMYYVSIGIFWRGDQGMNFELAEVPQGKARVTPLTETALAVGAKSKNPDAAYRALRGLVGAAEKTALAPARQSLARDMRQIESRLSDQDIRVITSSLGYARGPVYENHQRVIQALRNTLETPVLAGSSTPEEGARNAATAIDVAMKQKK